jgi:hypothetical protein
VLADSFLQVFAEHSLQNSKRRLCSLQKLVDDLGLEVWLGGLPLMRHGQPSFPRKKESLRTDRQNGEVADSEESGFNRFEIGAWWSSFGRAQF